MRVGFIGLGNIGKPMAAQLVKGGLAVTVFDLRRELCCDLQAQGAEVATSCAEVAARAEVIGVCVRDDAEVRAVTVEADGIVHHAHPGTVIALHSTILPSTVEAVARAAVRRGIDVVDAPITGGAAGAESGSLIYMVGGEASAVDRCRPVFATSAKKIFHTGVLGSGAATKLCNNLIGYLSFLAAYEASSLASHAGLAFDTLLEVTRTNGYMTDTMLAFARYRQRAEEQPDEASIQALARNFTDLAEKDLAVTLAFARELGITLPGTALCQQLMARVYGLRDDKRR